MVALGCTIIDSIIKMPARKDVLEKPSWLTSAWIIRTDSIFNNDTATLLYSMYCTHLDAKFYKVRNVKNMVGGTSTLEEHQILIKILLFPYYAN